MTIQLCLLRFKTNCYLLKTMEFWISVFVSCRKWKWWKIAGTADKMFMWIAHGVDCEIYAECFHCIIYLMRHYIFWSTSRWCIDKYKCVMREHPFRLRVELTFMIMKPLLMFGSVLLTLIVLSLNTVCLLAYSHADNDKFWTVP